MQSTRPNYDAEFCGKLPLNQTNLIQPHGVFVLLSREAHEIIQISENCSALFEDVPEALMNVPVARFLTKKSYQAFVDACNNLSEEKLPVKLIFRNSSNQDHEYLAIVHAGKEQLALEIELPSFTGSGQNSFVEVFQKVKRIMSNINAAADIAEVCAVAAKEIKAMSGFDKVMIYSFDEEWNGTVIAEAKEEEMESYFGLKFPASDIPKPARDMYFRNPYRIIPNRDYVPVRLYPLLNPLSNTFTNLAGSNLRSVASVHLEYLRNMNVVASMSTRIIYQNKLWGLISCHHRTAKYLSYEECQVFELLSDVISSRIALTVEKEAFKEKEQLGQRFAELVEDIYRYDSLINAMEHNKEELMKYLRAKGLYFNWNGVTITAGTVPGVQEMEILKYWLQTKQDNRVYHHTSLSSVFDEAVTYSSEASGVMALPIQAAKGNYLIVFRPEAVQTVSWGGNPNEALQFEKGGTGYHPRNSFSQWQEVVRNTAAPWQEAEVEAAENLRNVLVEFALKKLY